MAFPVIRHILFFGLMTLLFSGINWLALRRATKTFELGSRGRLVLGALLFGSLAGTLLGRAAGVLWDADLGPVVPVSSVIQLAMLLTVALLVPWDLLGLGRRLVQYARARRAPAPEPPNGANPPEPADQPEQAERRVFLERAVVGGSALIASSSSLYGTLSGRHDYRIEEVPIRVAGLKPSLDGFTIVQLSDIHIGDQVGPPELAAAWDLVQRCKPDLVVLTGDLLDNDPRYAEELGRLARRLGPLARYGVAAVTGNHDFYAGVDSAVAALRRADAQVLRNEGLVLGDGGGAFALLGVDDVIAPRFQDGASADVHAALRHLPESADLPRVLLCHNPSYFRFAAGHVDLQLSGHTHGGQIRLGISPADLFLRHGWIRGRYQREGSELYVNRGFGTVGPPARIGAPPEVTRLVLHS